MGRDSNQDVTVRQLIESHDRFAQSRDTFEQVVGTLWVAGMLAKRLNNLTDRQIAQLLSDVVGDKMSIFGPGMTICQQATLRLFRSPVGRLVTTDIEGLKAQSICPKCGNEMLLRYGIDEPDYQECVLSACGHKIPA